jgi:hypothetical protein
MRADIIKAIDESRQCREVISNVRLAVDPYLRSKYSTTTTRLQELMMEWGKRFPGEPAFKVVMVSKVRA